MRLSGKEAIRAAQSLQGLQAHRQRVRCNARQGSCDNCLGHVLQKARWADAGICCHISVKCGSCCTPGEPGRERARTHASQERHRRGRVEQETLNVDRLEWLEYFLGVQCAVLRRHLADALWPLVLRRLKMPLPSTLCTCLEFMHHSDCEHIVYAKALQGDANSVDLWQMPVVRKRLQNARRQLLHFIVERRKRWPFVTRKRAP